MAWILTAHDKDLEGQNMTDQVVVPINHIVRKPGSEKNAVSPAKGLRWSFWHSFSTILNGR